MAYNKQDDRYITGSSKEELEHVDTMSNMQFAINQYCLHQPIDSMTVTELLDTLHSLHPVVAYAQPLAPGLKIRKYYIQQAINREIQAYIRTNY